MTRKNNKLPFRLRMLSAVIAASMVISGCGPGGEGGAGGRGEQVQAETKIPVEVAVASKQSVQENFQTTASLEPEAEAQVTTKTSGVILKLMVEEGDKVRAGQLMATLESDRQRLSMLQARAMLRKLENDFKRQEELNARKLIGQDVFERSKFDLENQRAAFDMAQLELSYTEIRAPIAGTVSKRFVKEGNLIGLNQAVFKIDDFEPLQAVLNVPEKQMMKIEAGQPVQMLVDALPGQFFSGNVARVAPTVDSASGTFRVTTQFSDESGALRSGMFGRINLVYQRRDEVLVVPRNALLDEDGGAATVFMVLPAGTTSPTAPPAEPDDKAKADTTEQKAVDGASGELAKVDEGPKVRVQKLKVQLGYVGDGIAEIVRGLDPGAQVVVLGQAALRDNSLVEVLASQVAPQNVSPSEATAAANDQ